MTNKLTEKIIILDRSGSMSSCKSDMQGGLNSYIQKQKEIVKEFGGKCKVTYVTFDDKIETQLEDVDVNLVGELTLDPRGYTALYDAIGTTLSKVEERYSSLAKKDIPDLIEVIVITDGGENASKEFNSNQIKKIISKKEEAGWQFTYLGANQDAFAVGNAALGMKSSSVANYNTRNAGQTFDGIAAKSLRMYEDVVKFGAVSQESEAFTDSERSVMV